MKSREAGAIMIFPMRWKDDVRLWNTATTILLGMRITDEYQEEGTCCGRGGVDVRSFVVI